MLYFCPSGKDEGFIAIHSGANPGSGLMMVLNGTFPQGRMTYEKADEGGMAVLRVIAGFAVRQPTVLQQVLKVVPKAEERLMKTCQWNSRVQLTKVQPWTALRADVDDDDPKRPAPEAPSAKSTAAKAKSRAQVIPAQPVQEV